MMLRKEMKRLLAERAERIDLLEQRLETLTQSLDAYKAREQAIVDTLSRASDAAKQCVAGAEAQAQRLVEQAKAEADTLLSAAREEKNRMLADTEKTVRDYEATLAAYNADLARSAAEAEATAARYAAFLKERRIDTGELFNEVGGGATLVSLTDADALPDPAEDPKTLMQNIYKLQHRDIPESTVAPADLIEEIIADLGPRPAEMEAPAPEPEPMPEPEPVLEEPEWQPEQEAEWRPEDEPDVVPSVSELLPDAVEEEVSLDALLEEIIAAGDI